MFLGTLVPDVDLDLDLDLDVDSDCSERSARSQTQQLRLFAWSRMVQFEVHVHDQVQVFHESCLT